MLFIGMLFISSVQAQPSSSENQQLGPQMCISIVGSLSKVEQGGLGLWGDAHAGRTSFASRRHPTGRRVFIFDPKKPAWAAYDERGRLVRTGHASGGKAYCPDVKRRCLTPTGHFSVHRKGNAYCKSSKYPVGRGGAPMPHCMFFYKGYAIHGSPHVPNYNASHGCIRVLPKDARWLHRHFMTLGTQVIVRRY